MTQTRSSYLLCIFLSILLCLLGTITEVPQAHASSKPHTPRKIYGSTFGPFTTYNYDGVFNTYCIPGWNSTTDYNGYVENYAQTNGSKLCAQATWDFGGTQYYYCKIQIWVPSNFADEPNLGFGLFDVNTRIAVLHINENNYTDQWVTLPGSNNYGPVTKVQVSNNTGDTGYYVGLGAFNHSLEMVC